MLVSGGLDSATTLAIARAAGHETYALSVDYGQRHRVELDAARRVARAAGVADHRIMRVDLAGIGGSALTDPSIAVPEAPTTGIPVTYVPARNTIMLSLALGWAEVLGARHIYVGVNAVDYSGYPDCRPQFVAAFERLANLATKAGVEGTPPASKRRWSICPRPKSSVPGSHWGRLRTDPVVLSARCRRACLWAMRLLPAAAGRVRTGGRAGPHSLRLTGPAVPADYACRCN